VVEIRIKLIPCKAKYDKYFLFTESSTLVAMQVHFLLKVPAN